MLAPSKTSARRGMAFFLATLTGGSACLEWLLSASNGPFARHFLPIYMWWVAASSMAARLLLREGVSDISFRWGGWAGTRSILIATALPLAVGLVSYGFAWNTGLAHFSAAAIAPTALGIPIAGSPVARFCKFLFISVTAGALWACRSAAGEEIGWRGYLLTRLIDSGLPAPIFLSSLVWALWHMPLLFAGQYQSVPLSALGICTFVVNLVGTGYVFAWLRLSSRSIWPCVWAHGAWNAVILGCLDSSTRGSSVWVGEAGLITALFVILFAVTLYRIRPLPLSPVKK